MPPRGLRVASDVFVALTDSFLEAMRMTAVAIVATSRIVGAILVISAPIALILWSCGHDERLRQRIAREGCPYAQNADETDLPGAREREFHRKYC
jgi:hypothetical protein